MFTVPLTVNILALSLEYLKLWMIWLSWLFWLFPEQNEIEEQSKDEEVEGTVDIAKKIKLSLEALDRPTAATRKYEVSNSQAFKNVIVNRTCYS